MIEMIIFFKANTPVSYTHLDVYKRQTYMLVKERAIGRVILAVP